MDLVGTAEHYRDRLGFEIEPYFGDPPVFTHVRRGAVFIQLGKCLDPDRATRAPDGVGLNAYIWVDDVDALHREYLERGAEIVEGPVVRSYRCRELVVRDCNGLILCFAQDAA